MNNFRARQIPKFRRPGFVGAVARPSSHSCLMRILGHGIDLVELGPFRRLLSHAEEDFLHECFSDVERSAIPDGVNRVQHIAGQFAAKEAVTKALGTGFGDGVAFVDVEVGRTPAGAPVIQLHGGAAARASSLGINTWLVSISHGESTAIASVIAVAASE